VVATKNRGVGIAAMIQWTADAPAGANWGSATVRITSDGKAVVASGTGEMGQGIETTLTQITADELSLSLEDVSLVTGDSDLCPPDLGSYGSRSAVVAGTAVMMAAIDAKQRLLKAAAEMMEANPDDLELREGRICVKGLTDPSKSLGIAEVATAVHLIKGDYEMGGIIGRGNFDAAFKGITHIDIDCFGDFAYTYTYAANAVEVEVDTETGQVKVLHCVPAHDVGKAINPMLVEGQITGGLLSQGLGYTLYENMAYDTKTGQLLSPSFTDYKIPTIADAPEVTPIIVEEPDPKTPYGQKGVGETALACVAGAVGNAVFDAVGVRITELPITPERVLEALRKRES
jgi:CO/xanthine dehydrogenase Mo-binding subunit